MLNDILVDSDLGRMPVFVASVDCAKAFGTVSFPALLEPLSDPHTTRWCKISRLTSVCASTAIPKSGSTRPEAPSREAY